MDAVHATLRKVRDWFLVWFVIEASVGIAAAAYVLELLTHDGLLRQMIGGVDAAGTVLAGIAVSLGLLLLAWFVFEALLDLRAWARMVLLVIGWITVVSAAIDLVTLPASAGLLGSLVGLRGSGWPLVMAASALSKLADLAFWSYALYTLQMNPPVRAAFLHAAPAATCPR